MSERLPMVLIQREERPILRMSFAAACYSARRGRGPLHAMVPIFTQASKIVAKQVDNHDLLASVLLIVPQQMCSFAIVNSIYTPWPGALHRTGRDLSFETR